MLRKLKFAAASVAFVSAAALVTTSPAVAQGASADTKDAKTTSSTEAGGATAPKGATSADTKGTMTTSSAPKSKGAMSRSGAKGSKSKAAMRAKKKRM